MLNFFPDRSFLSSSRGNITLTVLVSEVLNCVIWRDVIRFLVVAWFPLTENDRISSQGLRSFQQLRDSCDFYWTTFSIFGRRSQRTNTQSLLGSGQWHTQAILTLNQRDLWASFHPEVTVSIFKLDLEQCTCDIFPFSLTKWKQNLLTFSRKRAVSSTVLLLLSQQNHSTANS